ncbi:MAG TPA: efflux RND transporter permease subunit [Anaeromyxobacter sp.]|nr:efflux RND transporter permease subunit [Anaeromyxobacter sp.]
MVNFFIDRPIFAWVIAILIMLAGAIAITTLPVSQYPAIAPPNININAVYPGASAKTVEDAVTQVIEQKMNGIDHLRYLSSTSDSSGTASVTLTFDANTNPDIAQVQVQNKLQLAMPLLPEEVQRQGVRVQKAVNNYLLIAAFVSKDGSMSRSDLADYAATAVVDPIGRVTGVGDVQLFGAQYAMRVWLDPQRLTGLGLTPGDVAAAILTQNALVSAGQLGGTPASPGQEINATITAQTRLQSPREFERILLRVAPGGAEVRLRDVARVELAGEIADVDSLFNNQPAAAIGIKLAPGANALKTVQAVKARFDELARYFPRGMEVRFPIDTTTFVRISIEDVVKTLLEAIGLVFLVMFLFLQNFRATLIPTIAVPVVLLGTFGVLSVFGFGINTLTMFGLVLAIGLLVDDAIVVVENVERVMSEEGLLPREAARRSMGQITGALVGIAMVLSAVFIPMAFFGGSVGVIYRQFSITLVSSMVLSVVVALVLTPALCATLLRRVPEHHGAKRAFGWFNRLYDFGLGRYLAIVRSLLHRFAPTGLVYLVVVAVLTLLLGRLPTGFLPDEDQGTMFVQVQLPPGATLERTREVLKRVTDHLLTDEKDAVDSVIGIVGFNFAGRAQSNGVAFVRLRDWNLRSDPRLRAKAVAARVTGALQREKEAIIFAFTPPAVAELGNVSGFDMQLQDRAGLGHEALLAARNQLLGAARNDPVLVRVRPNGQDDGPQYKIDVDWGKAAALGISLAEINANLSSTWGVRYVNDFIDRGRVKKVYMQSDAPFRMQPGDVDRWYVRSRSGAMTPFSAFASGHWTYGSPRLERFNGTPSLEIVGEPSPGHSTGEAMKAMERLVSALPAGIGQEWTGLSFEERLASANEGILYGISLLVVFLCLAALYESWSIPFVVMLVVPLGVVGAALAATVRGAPSDVFFQVGLLTTIGLSAKNAILIVEFARAQYESGRDLIEATLEASRMRLRPILMTSMAFILGVLPLAVANGAGSGGQNAIGWAVAGGMASATALAVLIIPVFFVTVVRLTGRRRRSQALSSPPAGGTRAGEDHHA